ncbi:MAG: Hpt domain-containing protein [Bdellovibrionales bacterium]
MERKLGTQTSIAQSLLVRLTGEDPSDFDPHFISQLIDIYLRNTPDRLDSLCKSLEERDSDSVRRVAHSLRSSSALLGLRKMELLCRGLENLHPYGNLDDIGIVVASLRQEYNTVKQGLETYTRRAK